MSEFSVAGGTRCMFKWVWRKENQTQIYFKISLEIIDAVQKKSIQAKHFEEKVENKMKIH